MTWQQTASKTTRGGHDITLEIWPNSDGGAAEIRMLLNGVELLAYDVADQAEADAMGLTAGCLYKAIDDREKAFEAVMREPAGEGDDECAAEGDNG